MNQNSKMSRKYSISAVNIEVSYSQTETLNLYDEEAQMSPRQRNQHPSSHNS